MANEKWKQPFSEIISSTFIRSHGLGQGSIKIVCNTIVMHFGDRVSKVIMTESSLRINVDETIQLNSITDSISSNCSSTIVNESSYMHLPVIDEISEWKRIAATAK